MGVAVVLVMGRGVEDPEATEGRAEGGGGGRYDLGATDIDDDGEALLAVGSPLGKTIAFNLCCSSILFALRISSFCSAVKGIGAGAA